MGTGMFTVMFAGPDRPGRVMGDLLAGKCTTTMIHVGRSPFRKFWDPKCSKNKVNSQTGMLDRVPQLTYIHKGNIIIYLKIMVRTGLLSMTVQTSWGHM